MVGGCDSNLSKISSNVRTLNSVQSVKNPKKGNKSRRVAKIVRVARAEVTSVSCEMQPLLMVCAICVDNETKKAYFPSLSYNIQ